MLAGLATGSAAATGSMVGSSSTGLAGLALMSKILSICRWVEGGVDETQRRFTIRTDAYVTAAHGDVPAVLLLFNDGDRFATVVNAELRNAHVNFFLCSAEARSSSTCFGRTLLTLRASLMRACATSASTGNLENASS